MTENPYRNQKSHALSGSVRKAQNKELRQLETQWDQQHGHVHYALTDRYTNFPKEGVAWHCQCGRVDVEAGDPEVILNVTKRLCPGCGLDFFRMPWAREVR